MYFARIALFALPALAAAAILPRDNVCQNGGQQFCCNNLQKADTLSKDQKSLATLAGFDTDNAGTQFGSSCTPITNSAGLLSGALSKSSASCNSNNVCCQGATSNGALANNCSPVTAN